MNETGNEVRRGPGRPPSNPRVESDEPRASRSARRPFGAQRQKLAYEPREGFHRHWFNDVGGRIQEALAAGYTHVTDSSGKNVSHIGGSHPHGGALTMYLMEIPIEWYEEDRAAKQKLVDEQMAAIKAGTANPVENVYGDIKVTSPAIR